MNIGIFLFYLFSSFALLSSLMVIGLSNAVHSVLFLILVFCNVAGLLLLLGAEFLSFMLIIIYVGAIAVLFLFVVMMLNTKVNSVVVNSSSVWPIGVLIFVTLLLQLFNSTYDLDLTQFHHQKELLLTSWAFENSNSNNVQVIGKVLYTYYSLLFLICGLILLVAMIGVIVLTMHQRVDAKTQEVNFQLARAPGKVVKFLNLRRLN
uniref:NADH-ubiquinone oxidoreductase chain 6 n=1 Tax=Mastocarpus papillatus TaxID=31436 RepID=A0A342RZ65_9FLOR|nr:NADH dehydrogenase subunit 6 [Mastocarpus papillatus]AOL58011.1 NADH dehydrogenase subunit 6 [Mastocarpus papillatus]